MSMTIKKLLIIFCLSNGLFLSSHSFTDDDFFEDDEFSEFEDFVDYLEDHPDVTTRDEDLTPCTVVGILTNPLIGIELQSKLQNDFYIFTHPINTRSLLDEPFATLHFCCYPKNWQLNFWTFYNQTSKGNWTKNGTQISDYLALDNDAFFRDLDEELLPDIDIPRALDLVRIFKIQERRAGIMLGGYWAKGCWNIEFKTPLYYFERNFFLTNQEQRAIERFFNSQDITPLEVDESLIRKHVMSDKVGIGDTRLSFGHVVYDCPSLWLNVGVEATIPTAITFKEGLYGGKFEKNSNHPPFCLFELFKLQMCPPKDLAKIQKIILDFAVAAFDKLPANVLDTGLGNNGHFGLALFAEKHMCFRRFTFRTRAALEYLFPAHEKRFYITTKNREAFKRDYDDCTQADENLAFLNEQLIDTVIPKVFSTTIKPGFIFKFSSMISRKFGCNWEFGLGYDLWWLDREKLGKIKATPTQLANIQIGKGIKPGAYANKIISSVTYATQEDSCNNWCLTLYADRTFLTDGVGHDFNVALRFSRNY